MRTLIFRAHLLLLLCVAVTVTPTQAKPHKHEPVAAELDFELKNENDVKEFLNQKWALKEVHTRKPLPGEKQVRSFGLADPNCFFDAISSVSQTAIISSVKSYIRFDDPNISLFIEYSDRSFTSRFTSLLKSETQVLIADCKLHPPPIR